MRVALITGAGGGLGNAAVTAYRSAGWTVIPADVAEGPWSVNENSPLLGIIGDPEWKKSLQSMAPAGLDAVVAAHGIEGTGGLLSLDVKRVATVMKVNFETVAQLHEATVELLAKKSGAFVAISSQAGVEGEPAAAAYCASKFAVREYVKLQAKHHGKNVRYRVLCPGATETPLLKKAFEGIASAEGITYKDVLARRSAAVPIQRLGRPEDIGSATLWLAELETKRVAEALVTGGEVLR